MAPVADCSDDGSVTEKLRPGLVLPPLAPLASDDARHGDVGGIARPERPEADALAGLVACI